MPIQRYKPEQIVTMLRQICHFDFGDQIESCFVQYSLEFLHTYQESHAVRTNGIGTTLVTHLLSTAPLL